ncbi:MAG: hypothetical protein LW870_08840 [Pirellula sp.]|nr:hypothetical protein [Pirellula sp.]
MRNLAIRSGYLAFPRLAYSSLTANEAIQYGKEKVSVRTTASLQGT